jgi:hypothetical protein
MFLNTSAVNFDPRPWMNVSISERPHLHAQFETGSAVRLMRGCCVYPDVESLFDVEEVGC